jgi:hypothetical protein
VKREGGSDPARVLALVADAVDAVTAAGVSLGAVNGHADTTTAQEIRTLRQQLAQLGERIGDLMRRLEQPI